MNIVIYAFAGAFVLMASALIVTFAKTRHPGVFLLAVTYGASAGLAVTLMHWWPLAAGFSIAWLLKLGGMDPSERMSGTKSGETPKVRQ